MVYPCNKNIKRIKMYMYVKKTEYSDLNIIIHFFVQDINKIVYFPTFIFKNQIYRYDLKINAWMKLK